jgi:hypothetical protein
VTRAILPPRRPARPACRPAADRVILPTAPEVASERRSVMPSVPVLILLFAVAVVVAVGVACGCARRRSFRPIAERTHAGDEWRTHFPAVSDADIHAFLTLFEDAFAVGREHALKFRPDDRIMDIYRAVNPPGWTMADQMEMEIFGLTLDKRYGVKLGAIWRDDLTLGEVFRETITRG